MKILILDIGDWLALENGQGHGCGYIGVKNGHSTGSAVHFGNGNGSGYGSGFESRSGNGSGIPDTGTGFGYGEGYGDGAGREDQ